MGNSTSALKGRGAADLNDEPGGGGQYERSKSSARRVAGAVVHRGPTGGAHPGSTGGERERDPPRKGPLADGVARFLGRSSGLLGSFGSQGSGRSGEEDLLGKECRRKRLDAVYELQGVIGRGQVGIVSRCRHKGTGRVFACKTLVKQSMDSAKSRVEAQREVEILVRLKGHPNIVSIEDVFEDHAGVHIVQELCSGGPLTDRISRQGEYGEQAAANIMRVALQVVHHCHAHGIIHRDLKLANFLLSDPSDAAVLKAIDFGASCFVHPGEKLTEMAGTPLYMAPEVVHESYGIEADVWSCGVVLYTLLSGRPPFSGGSILEIFDNIKSQPLDLETSPWPLVSGDARALLRRMLERDPSKRPTAAQLLDEPWVKGESHQQTSSSDLASIILPRLKKTSNMGRLRQLALLTTARYLPEEKLRSLREVFEEVDADGSGLLSLKELQDALQRVGAVMSADDVRSVFAFVDLDASGHIDYTEFVAASMAMQVREHTAEIRRTFERLDSDGSGSIEVREFVDVCAEHNMGERGDLQALVEGALVDAETGKPTTSIDYSSFLAMVTGDDLKDMSWALGVL